MKLKDSSFVNRPLSTEAARDLQELPLDEKILMTLIKIDEWEHATKGEWYISFSGGKDSTVLAYLAARYLASYIVQPHPLRLVFADTGLEYPEIRRFAIHYPDYLQSKFPGLEVTLTRVRPEERFDRVISTYGYPLIAKEISQSIFYSRHIYKNDDERRGQLMVGRQMLLGKYDERLEELRKQKAATTKEDDIEDDDDEVIGEIVTDADAEEVQNTDIAEDKARDTPQYDYTRWLPLTMDLPARISHKCCDHTKKQPMNQYQATARQWPVIGVMASESRMRRRRWLKLGCNAFESRHPKSWPMSFWQNQDVLRFIVNESIPIASVYGDIIGINSKGRQCPTNRITCKLDTTKCKRTGQMIAAHWYGNISGKTR